MITEFGQAERFTTIRDEVLWRKWESYGFISSFESYRLSLLLSVGIISVLRKH
ncbi:MAG: hypothetical protein K0S39_6239 [Paenibacillus sp.]|jgi:hypothetical protein|nr:hypothetical protein [Paenibacillus sp.]